MSPVNSFYSYPAYRRVLIVNLNKDTQTAINKIPTGSSPDLSQLHLTKNSASAFVQIFP